MIYRSLSLSLSFSLSFSGIPGLLIGLYGLFYGVGTFFSVFFDWNNYLREKIGMDLKTIIIVVHMMMTINCAGNLFHLLVFNHYNGSLIK